MRQRYNIIKKSEALHLISTQEELKLSPMDQKIFDKCVRGTSLIGVLRVDNDLLCMFGLVPASLVSQSAYLWLHSTEKVKDHEFVFVRQSQIMIRHMLKQFPTITGHCEVGAEKSQRWLRWLGAKFGPPEGGLVPFTITRE